MRENRPYGSEGGGIEIESLPTPIAAGLVGRSLTDDIPIAGQFDLPALNRLFHSRRRESGGYARTVLGDVLVALVADRTHLRSIESRVFDDDPGARFELFD